MHTRIAQKTLYGEINLSPISIFSYTAERRSDTTETNLVKTYEMKTLGMIQGKEFREKETKLEKIYNKSMSTSL